MVLCPIVFMELLTKPAIISKQNSHFSSVQKTEILTSASRLQKHHVLAEVSGHICIVHSQSALYFFFVGSIAELKVNSWSKGTLQQLFQDWLSVMWTSNFSSSINNHGFCFLQAWCPTVFTSSGHHVLLKFGPQDILSNKVLKKCATYTGTTMGWVLRPLQKTLLQVILHVTFPTATTTM